MKILDVQKFEPVLDARGADSFWETRTVTLGDLRSGTYEYGHVWHDTCLEWRIAEYAMDPSDVDAVLHLLLHEHLCWSKRDEVTCYTPGFTPQAALQHRLKIIQGHIDRHEAKMTPQHKSMMKHSPHQHPAFNPIRELGARDEVLHPRLLYVEGILAKKEGKKNYATGKIKEAHALLEAEHHGRKGPWQLMRRQLQQQNASPTG